MLEYITENDMLRQYLGSIKMYRGVQSPNYRTKKYGTFLDLYSAKYVNHNSSQLIHV